MANKYHAKKTLVDGIPFDSKREAQYYQELCLQKYARSPGERVVSIQRQIKFELLPAFTKNGVKWKEINYFADFIVKFVDEHEEIIDVKGMETDVFKIKHKLFEYRYPNLTLKIIK